MGTTGNKDRLHPGWYWGLGGFLVALAGIVFLSLPRLHFYSSTTKTAWLGWPIEAFAIEFGSAAHSPQLAWYIVMHWPMFVADALLCFSVFTFALAVWLKRRQRRLAAAAVTSPPA